VWRQSDAWRFRANLQRAFRRPTLNELYRPFRVGPNVTEANPELRTERVNSGELGVEWTLRGMPVQPPDSNLVSPPLRRPVLTLGAVAFWNDLRDAVGNVTIAHGPGIFPIVGFVAAGGVGRQRLNLERSRVQGLELSARWRPARGAALTADYLYNDATVRRSTLAPGLEGNRLAQVARQSAALGAALEWAGFILTPRVRWIGRQFEDDENELVLGEVVVGDIGITRGLGPHMEIFLNVENLGDARIETGRTAVGLVNVGTPRLAMLGVRASW
ncbi:MAG: TonB-dependent receptor, partial [Opitutus sp.]